MDNLCRTCLSQSNELISIFKVKFLDKRIYMLLSLCTGLETSKWDEFSNEICKLCLDKLLDAYIFREMCWKSNEYFIKNLNQINLTSTEFHECDVVNDIQNDIAKPEIFSENPVLKETSQLKITKSSKLIDKHQTIKNKVRGRQCYICPETFFSLTTLKRHLVEAHNVIYNESLIPAEAKTCTVCNKQVKTFQALRKHARVHTLVRKPGICDYCGKKFKNIQNLSVHMRSHTGEKPFKCDKCDFRTIHESSLGTHKITHINERNLECSTCHKKFKASFHLRRHVRVHDDKRTFICLVCQKTFKRRNDWRKHMGIHDVTTYLGCSFCDKKFARRENLKTHLKQHTGERPHVCAICGKGFIQRHCWRTHMKNHHNQIVT